MTDLAERNVKALMQTIQQLSTVVYEQKSRIDGLMNTIHGIMDRVGALESVITAMRVSKSGHGPTA